MFIASLFTVTAMTKGFIYGFISGAWIIGMVVFIILRLKGKKAVMQTELRRKITWREFLNRSKR